MFNSTLSTLSKYGGVWRCRISTKTPRSKHARSRIAVGRVPYFFLEVSVLLQQPYQRAVHLPLADSHLHCRSRGSGLFHLITIFRFNNIKPASEEARRPTARFKERGVVYGQSAGCDPHAWAGHLEQQGAGVGCDTIRYRRHATGRIYHILLATGLSFVLRPRYSYSVG